MSRRLLLSALLALSTLIPASYAAVPASASVTGQCSVLGYCLNFWNGGFPVRTWHGLAGNSAVSVQWFNSYQFELRDNVHGGCIGDYGNNPDETQAGGGLTCPSAGHAGYGTIFTFVSCAGSGGWKLYRDQHWTSYISFIDANNEPVWLTGGGNCMKQE